MKMLYFNNNPNIIFAFVTKEINKYLMIELKFAIKK